MRIMIDLPPDLEQDLVHQATQSNISLQTLIVQSLRQITQSPTTMPHWPEAILAYEGTPEFPAFESYRSQLLPPREPDLF